MTKPTRRATPVTRERLLDAAAELITELGWTAVTSRAVAERAGVNNGVVHYHFGSMDTLRRSAVSHAIDPLMREALEWFVAAPTALDAYSTLLSTIGQMDASQAPTAVLLEAMLHAPRDTEVQGLVANLIAPFRGALEDKLRADIDAGHIRDDVDVHGTAVALAALLDGLMLHAMVDPQVSLDRAVKAINGMLAAPSSAAHA